MEDSIRARRVAMRIILSGGVILGHALLAAGGLAAFYIFLACWLFARACTGTPSEQA